MNIVDSLIDMRHVLETITGLIAPGKSFAVRVINSSEEKCPNAIRYVNNAMS